MTSRKEFLSTSGRVIAGLGASSMLPTTAFSILSNKSPNDQIVCGLIGCKGMGWTNLRALMRADDNITCGALCDVDQNVLNERATEFENVHGYEPELYKRLPGSARQQRY